MFRTLLDKVRVEGQIDVAQEPSIRDVLPLIYQGEASLDSPNAVSYYSSGGRSLMFERNGQVYRIKGVDPFGKLTERVATSPKNRIGNVRDSHKLALLQRSQSEAPLMYLDGKPFGPFFLEQAEAEANALKRLAVAYEKIEAQNPCEFVLNHDSGIEVAGRRTYQAAFTLPSLESDFRTHEWNSLLTERLDECSSEEIAAKSRNINRLYGRFIYWAGINAAILAVSGLLPTETSFVPQNWVISKYRNGYGLFRIDHTSTKIVDPREVWKSLTEKKEGTPRMINEFSVFASRVQVAASPEKLLAKNMRKRKFREILFADKGIQADERRLLEVHMNAFNLGMQSVLEYYPINPIPEEMFQEALA